jgi:hypothetical protein
VPHSKIARRTFLLLSSAFSVGLGLPIARQWLQPIADQPPDAASVLPGLGQRVAIGFWQPEQKKRPDGTGFVSNIVAADSLRTGDKTFVQRGVRVQIQGGQFDQDTWDDRLQSLVVNVYYPGNQSHAEQKVCVWCLQVAPVFNRPAANRFLMPVTATSGLKLSVTATYRNPSTAEALTPEEILAQFTVGNQANQPRLRRGTYLVASALPDGTLPDWKEYQLRWVDGNGMGSRHELMRRDRSRNALVAAEFPYLLVSVDYGDASVTSA